MGNMFFLLLASLEGVVYADQPIMVAKSLGLERLSESYLLSEKIEQAIEKEYGMAVGILSGNPCASYTCQIEALQSDQTRYLILIDLIKEDEQYATLIKLYDTQKKKIRYNKKVQPAALTEIMETLPQKVVKLSKRYFSVMDKESSEQSSSASATESAVAKEDDTVSDDVSEAEEVQPTKEPTSPREAFKGFRVRAGGMLLYGQYAQKAEVIGQDLAADVSFATILPNFYAQGEMRFESIPLHVYGSLGVDTFGTTYADETSFYTMNQIRVAALYYKALSPNLILEGGLSYGNFSALSYIFESERTGVGSLTQNKAGVGVDVALLTQVGSFDVRLSISELLNPMPIQTQGSLFVEWSAGTIAGYSSSFHAGINAQLQHFTLAKGDEEAAINNLQVGLSGGYGIWF